MRQLAANGEKNKSPNQDKHNFLLRGLVRCGSCGQQMTPNFAYSKGRKYFYYKCVSVNKLDKSACPTRSAPARELERLILDRLAFLGKNKRVVEEVVERARQRTGSELPAKKQQKVRLVAEIGRLESEVGNVTAILAAQGQAAPQYRALMDKLGEVQARREELEKQVQRLDCEIVELETREIDVEIIRRNLENFSRSFARLTPQNQKELLALLIEEVVYDPQASKMKLTLRPLPDLGFEVVGDRVSFDERLNWLPGSNSKHTDLGSLARFIEDFHGPEAQAPWVYHDQAEFGAVNGAKGSRQILAPEAAQAIKDRRRAARQPRPPRVQVALARARELRTRLAADPSLTRDALAREIGMNPSQLTRLLWLAELAPEIQAHIRALPPTRSRGLLTERRLRPIARIKDHRQQLDRFLALLSLPVRALKAPSPARASVPSSHPGQISA